MTNTMAGQERKMSIRIIASAAVREAERLEADGTPDWVQPFEWGDAVVFADEVYTVGDNGDYEDYYDRLDAATALANSWLESIDLLVSSGEMDQATADEEIRRAARELAGVTV